MLVSGAQHRGSAVCMCVLLSAAGRGRALTAAPALCGSASLSASSAGLAGVCACGKAPRLSLPGPRSLVCRAASAVNRGLSVPGPASARSVLFGDLLVTLSSPLCRHGIWKSRRSHPVSVLLTSVLAFLALFHFHDVLESVGRIPLTGQGDPSRSWLWCN